MTQYLIMKCEELNDQWECDASREPMLVTEDWKNKSFDYRYEVYKIKKDGTLECIRNYDEIDEQGVALMLFTPKRPDGIVIKKWPDDDLDFQDNHLKIINEYQEKYGFYPDDCEEDYNSWSWQSDDYKTMLIYCRYYDDRFCIPW